MSTPLLVVAGEASGDLHAARLLGALGQRIPGLEVFGLGGDEMRAAGCETIADSAEISVVGITEVLKILPRAREIFAALLAEAERRRPQLAVLVDFPDFNLRLARELKKRGIPVVYYISPQVWAWRRGRIRLIAKVVDRMLVLFPFEVDFYRGRGVSAVHVGHPLVDEVPTLAQAWDLPRSSDEPFRVALLPGSRRSEVEALLPLLLAAVGELRRDRTIAARIVRAPSVPRELFERMVERSGVAVEIVEGEAEERFQVIADSHLALCASGTATLEVGLLGTPLVMVYRLGAWTYLLARLLVRLPHVSLVNLVLGERVIPEMIQSDARPDRVAAAARRLLDDPAAIATMRSSLARLRTALGASGASERAADEVARFLRPLASRSSAESAR